MPLAVLILCNCIIYVYFSQALDHFIQCPLSKYPGGEHIDMAIQTVSAVYNTVDSLCKCRSKLNGVSITQWLTSEPWSCKPHSTKNGLWIVWIYLSIHQYYDNCRNSDFFIIYHNCYKCFTFIFAWNSFLFLCTVPLANWMLVGLFWGKYVLVFLYSLMPFSPLSLHVWYMTSQIFLIMCINVAYAKVWRSVAERHIMAA